MCIDRISELPDPLLTQILSYLPIIDSVKTSVLSKRWDSLWLNVSSLELNDRDITSAYRKLFASFIDTFLELNRESRLQKVKIKYDECNINLFPISEWISTAVDLRGIQHLDVEIQNPMYVIDFVPVSVYKSKTLVFLKLGHVKVRNVVEVNVSLPCLKIMCLENVCYGKEGSLVVEKLISGCPVLEDLSLVRNCNDLLKNLTVRSESLKIFRLVFWSGVGGSEYEVEIDAPGLEYMSFKDNQSDKIVVKNLSSLVKIDVDSVFNVSGVRKSDTIREFLTGVSSVRQMIISQPTLEILYRYSKLVLVAEFQKLCHLQAAFSSSSLQLLPSFLESCPNLKHIILDFYVSTEAEQINLVNVPRCLTSTLECVEINKLIMREETGIKLVNYFLENAAVLKRLTVSFNDSPMTEEDLDIYKELLTSVKRSRLCQLFIS